MDVNNYPELESSAIIKERGNIYGTDKLSTLKENIGRGLYNNYRNQEKKDKETLEYKEKTEKMLGKFLFHIPRISRNKLEYLINVLILVGIAH
jgi:hypothetical protein